MLYLWIVFLFLFPITAYAADTSDLLEMEMEEMGFFDTDLALENGQTYGDLVEDIITGEEELTLGDLPQTILEMAFYEVFLQKKLMTQLLLIVILSAILKQLSESLQGKTVGEMGFAVCYMVLIVLITQCFLEISTSVVSRIHTISNSFVVMMPIFCILAVSGGNFAQVSLLEPTIMGGTAFLTFAIEHFFVPATLLGVSMEMVNHLSEKPILGRFAKLLRQCISWGMKGIAMVFVALLSLQKVGGGALNSLAVKTAQIAVSAVPVVGDVMGGAVETTGALVGTLKSGALVACIIYLLAICLPLIVQLIVILLVFQISAAASEFICESRLVDCIGVAGSYTGLLLGMVCLAEGMCLFSAILLLGHI